jgi:small subunit ribosomal protein S9
VSTQEKATYRATGKRKTSVARVILTPGSGVVTVNGRAARDYFGRVDLATMIAAPLTVANLAEHFDVRARIHGGGISGQAGALRHGIAKALVEADPNLRGDLKRAGFLARDAREVERKKAGLKKARKRPQFSKR